MWHLCYRSWIYKYLLLDPASTAPLYKICHSLSLNRVKTNAMLQAYDNTSLSDTSPTIIVPFSVCIDGRYKLMKKIGGTSCGGFFLWQWTKKLTSLDLDEVFAAMDILYGEDVMVKFQDMKMGRALQHEHRIQKALIGGIGIPQVCWFGTDSGIKAFIMEHLGPLLKCLLSQKHSHKFPVVTVTGIGCQLVCLPSCSSTF
jgi:hypothetical protein